MNNYLNNLLTGAVGHWIQVDLGSTRSISAIVTQGRGRAAQWVTTYKVQFGDDQDNLKYVTEINGEEKVKQTKSSNRFTHRSHERMHR